LWLKNYEGDMAKRKAELDKLQEKLQKEEVELAHIRDGLKGMKFFSYVSV
jgi:hypothetical protein